MDSPPADEEFVMADDYPAFIPPEPVVALVEKWFRLIDLPEGILSDISGFLTLAELQILKFECGSRYMYSSLRLKIERNHIIINDEKDLFYYLYPSVANKKIFAKVQEVSMLLNSGNVAWWMRDMLNNKFEVPKFTFCSAMSQHFSKLFSFAACIELNLINVGENVLIHSICDDFPNLKKLGMYTSLNQLNNAYSDPGSITKFYNFYSGNCRFKQLESISFPSACKLFPITDHEFQLLDAQFPVLNYFQEFNTTWRKEKGKWFGESEEVELEIKIKCKKRKFASQQPKKEPDKKFCNSCRTLVNTYHIINDATFCVPCLATKHPSAKTIKQLIVQCQNMKRMKPESEIVYQSTTSIVS